MEVEADSLSPGLMRPVLSTRLLVPADEVAVYPARVRLHDRSRLVRLAREGDGRCTVFFGPDEHVTFVLDPVDEPLLAVHVYDIEPPQPRLAAEVAHLEEAGLTGELDLSFIYHVRDIRSPEIATYPCRAAGFDRSLDRDSFCEGLATACCQTGRELIREVYALQAETIETCPCGSVDAEPFIVRCCRAERTGLQTINGRFGIVVHWGASQLQILDALRSLAAAWRERS
jgi:hypothetical protein